MLVTILHIKLSDWNRQEDLAGQVQAPEIAPDATNNSPREP